MKMMIDAWNFSHIALSVSREFHKLGKFALEIFEKVYARNINFSSSEVHPTVF